MFAQQPVSFGRYELIYRLGQGGMGEVHLARLTGAGGFEKLYVLKTILPQMSGDPQFVQRFQHEARLLVHLQHSNIAQVYDMGEVNGTFFMAVEYVPGVDLSRVLGRARQLSAAVPIPIALYLGQQVAEALGYAHRKTGAEGEPLGIVHRDISPHNVMVSYEGEIKVIDFGLAKSAAGSAQTLPSTVMGKLGYMSPEQARAEKVDHRSDIYSAGVVLWEMLAGRRLFDGESVGQMIAAMAHPVIPALRSIRPEVSQSLERVIHRALAPAPADRFARADELARALNEELVREGKQAGAEETGTYLRALCPEEFAEQRRLISTLNRRVSAAEAGGMEGTLLRDGAAAQSASSPRMTGSGGVPAAPMPANMTGAYGSGRVPVAQGGGYGSGGMPAAQGGYGPGNVQSTHGSGGMPAAHGLGGMPAQGSGGMPAAHGSGGMAAGYGPGNVPAAHGSGGMPAAHGSGGMPAQGSGGMAAGYGSGNMPAAHGSGGMPAHGSGNYGSGGMPAAPAQQRSRAPLYALGAVCLLLAGALGAVLMKRGGGETPPAPVAVTKVEPPPAPVKAEEPAKEPPSDTYERVAVENAFEVFEDRGNHFVRAGSEDGVSMGTEVQMVGPADAEGRRPLYGKALVMELTGPHLARLNSDAKPQAEGALFASFTPEPVKAVEKPAEKPRTTTRRPNTRTPAPAVAAPAPEVAAAPAPPPLRGRAEITGFGPLRRLVIFNRDQRPWTNCDLRLPSNKHYVLDRLKGGDQEAIAMMKFKQDGTEHDRENTWLNVKCNEGTAQFTLR